MLTFSDVHRNEADDWHSEGPFFTDESALAKLKGLIDSGAMLIAEHWHYRGARRQERFVIDDYDSFLDYLKKEAIAGDIIDVYDLSDSWSSKGKPIVSGKCPDRRGEIPRKGAY